MERPIRSDGFTLLELIITLAIAAILLTLGVPSYQKFIAGTTITAEINHLVSHLQLARSEAIKRGEITTLCATHDGALCSKSIEWQHGFMVFSDPNRNRKRDDGEEILALHRPAEERIKILSARSKFGRKTVAYYPTGMAPGSTVTFEICDTAKSATPKAVIVSHTGRPRVSEKRPDATAITCG